MEPFLILLEAIWESYAIFLQSLANGASLFPSMEVAFASLLPAAQGVAAGLLPVVLGVVLTILSLGFFGFFAPNAIVGYIIFVMHLKRTKPSKWSRECSSDAPSQVAMYDEGVAWSERFLANKQDVHIVSEGLNLYGEFYDFNSEKTVILVGGRTEGLRYGYYFARPYQECGYNILTIDNRAHGQSEGKYNTVGFEEHKDLLNWAKYLREYHHTQQIVFHGICIGSAGSLYALIHEDCPDYIRGIVADGMYPNFRESFRNHMIELKKPMFGLPFIEGWMKILTGHSMKYGPIDVIHRLDRPILMLHGTEDLYSLPEDAKKLYEKCGSTQKQIVWFEGGSHSLLRYADAEKYDDAIKDFLTKTMSDHHTAA